MAKKSQQQSQAHQNFVIATGYTLFGFMVLGLVINTILPLAHILSTPHARTVNILVFLISLVLSALLPTIIAYFVGGASTRPKNRQLHHYNGVMLGVLAYWIDVIVSQFNPGSTSFIYDNLPVPVNTAVSFILPVLLTAAAVSVLAFYYHSGKGKQQAISEYKPFQLSLIAAMGTFLIILPVQQVLSGFWYTYSAAITVMNLCLLLLAYIGLAKLHMGVLQRLTLVITSFTLALVAQYVTTQLIPGAYGDMNSLLSVPGVTMVLVSFMVVGLYLYVVRLSYRK